MFRSMCRTLATFAALLGVGCAESPGPDRVIRVDVTPALHAFAAIGESVQFSAVAKDAGANAIGGVSFAWSSSDTSIVTVSSTGAAAARKNGVARVTAITEGVSGSAQITVQQRRAAVSFAQSPGPAIAGEPLNPVVVELRDSSGHVVADDTSHVTITLGANPGNTTLKGAATVAAVAGIATFHDLNIERAATGYTLVATVPTLPQDNSAAFSVSHAALVLSFRSQPGTVEGQVVLPAIELNAREDRFGNLVPDTAVSLALAGNPAPQPLHGTTTVTAVSGIATFADLSLWLPGTALRLEARSGNAIRVQSDPFSVRLTFVQISAGDSHNCGVTVASFAYCWGANSLGTIGDSTTTNRATPTPVSGGLHFTTVEAGFDHTCGIAVGGGAYCWGFNYHGALGDGTTNDHVVPKPVAGSLMFQQLSAGHGMTCGVTTANAAYCWGDNGLGQLGDSSNQQRNAPTLVAGGYAFTQISAGETHTCAVTTGHDGYCWGNNTTAQLGHGAGNHEFAPALVSGGLSFAQVSVGKEFSCGVTVGHVGYCWGANSDGQLGDSTTAVRTVPTAVTGGLSFSQLDAGDLHSCGITTGNDAYCWGYNSAGEIGDGTSGSPPVLAPRLVVGGLRLAQVRGGYAHTCAIAVAYPRGYCWGLNNGVIGSGSPVPIAQ